MSEPRPGRHWPALDGVRGLAIVAVMLSHFVPQLASVFHTRWAQRWVGVFGQGAWGVDLFFVLSGFLITGILIETRSSPDYWRSFFGRRALRIFPLYYAFLAALYLTAAPSGPAWTFLLHLSNWRADGGVSSNVLTWHFWSLAVEEQFYLAWPLVVGLVPVRRLGPVCLAVAAASLLGGVAASYQGAEHETVHRMTPFALDGLGLGSFLAWAVRREGRLAPWLTRSAYVALPASVATYFAVRQVGLSWSMDLTVSRAIVSVGAGALVLLATSERTLAARLLVWPPLQLAGRYCYGLYLLHPVVVVYGVPLTQPLVDTLPRGWLPLAWVAVLTAGLLSSLALALATWTLIEAPCLRWKTRFPYRPAPGNIPPPHLASGSKTPVPVSRTPG